MTKEELADAICGFLRDTSIGDSSYRDLPIDNAEVLDEGLKEEVVIAVSTTDGAMFFVEVQDA